MIAQVEILDPAQWERYKAIASQAIAQYGGRYLTRGAHPEVREADWAPPENPQVNVVEFPSWADARAWYASPEYAKALVFRQDAVRRRLFFAPGLDETVSASDDS